MKWLAKILAWYFKWRYENKKPDFVITGKGNTPYLYRWWVIPRNKLFNIYLHKVVADDERHFHDHPWNSLGFILEGSYVEYIPYHQPKNRELLDDAFRCNLLEQGKYQYRDTNYSHYLIQFSTIPVWSLFFTGPKKRTWGFYHRVTRKWIDHVTWCEMFDKEVSYD